MRKRFVRFHIGGGFVCLLLAMGCANAPKTDAPASDVLSPAIATEPTLLVVDTNQFALLPSGFFGFDADLSHSPASFRNRRFCRAVENLRPATLSYPGSEIANVWDWRTGLAERDWIEYLDSDPGAPSNAVDEMLRAANLNLLKHGSSFDDFLDLCRRTKARPLGIVNVLYQTPESVQAWARSSQSLGVPVRFWTLGRGLYKPTYRALLPTPEEYVRRARRCAEQIRIADPKAALSVCVPISALGDRAENTDAYSRRWVESLARENFYDAVALELDSAFLDDESGTATAAVWRAARFADEDLPRAIERCARVFGNRPVWIADGRDEECVRSGESLSRAFVAAELAIASVKKTPLVERVFLMQIADAVAPKNGDETIRRLVSEFEASGATEDPARLRLRFGPMSKTGQIVQMLGALFSENERGVALDFYNPPRLPIQNRTRYETAMRSSGVLGLSAFALMGKDTRWVDVAAINRTADPLVLNIVIDRQRIRRTVEGRVLEWENVRSRKGAREDTASESDAPRVSSRTWMEGKIELPARSFAILRVRE